MATIQIVGLSPKQVILADLIWAMNDRERVEQFIRTLPDADAIDARIVMTMMLWAFLDEVMEVEDSVKELIDTYRY